MTEHAGETDDAVAVLIRWETFGGTWRVLDDRAGRLTISLCRCDGGEEQSRLSTSDPAMRAWLDGRVSSA